MFMLPFITVGVTFTCIFLHNDVHSFKLSRPHMCYLSKSSLFSSSRSDDNNISNNNSNNNEIDRDEAWMREGNKIEYVVGPLTQQFNSLQEIGLSDVSISSQRNITIIPFHLTSTSDLFCNRELNMPSIDAIGFDMDWTLAQYKEDFDLLSYNGAVNLLVETIGYPTDLYSYKYSRNMYRRGCVIDKKRGNILKLDRFKYVRVAEHGMTPLTAVERKSIYKYNHEGLHEMMGSNYENIDTPFSLIDTCLFAQLVDLKDRLSTSCDILASRSYNQLWLDCRKCVDKCHKNGAIKLTVAANPAKYIVYDPNIFPMLASFKKAGRKVFLLTNSLWEYTQVVMSYLEGRKIGVDKDFEWMKYFDVVIVGGNKPAFLTDDRDSLPIYRVHPSDGSLSNVDYIPPDPTPMLKRGILFQGGNAIKLHSLLNTAGDKILYVGDHIFSDILRTKRSLGWRTCLIVPELGAEINKDKIYRDHWRVLQQKRAQSIELESTLDELQYRLYTSQRASASLYLVNTASSTSSASSRFIQQREDTGEESVTDDERTLQRQISNLKTTVDSMARSIGSELDELSAAYHPHWGPLFRAGFKESFFAMQITDYACVYTSRASNLGFVSPHRPFRPPRDLMPHDRFLEGGSSVAAAATLTAGEGEEETGMAY